MATRIRASSKGQVVLPKSTRDRLGILAGTELDVVDTATGVELRPVKAAESISVDEGLRRLRGIVKYTGPRLDESDWQAGLSEAITGKWGQPPR